MFDRRSSPSMESAKRKCSSASKTYLDYENSPEHVDLTERLCKTLYYGYNTPPEYPSLPLSEIAVKFFQDAAPRSLGKVDMYLASSMTKHATMSPCSVMLGIIYVNRLKDKNPEYLMQISSADLFLISMMMASKYLYDEGVYEEVFNEDWAVVGMMETAEINQLEQDFLAALDWRLMVHKNEFKQLLDTIEKRIAFEESCKRGWLSYTDVWTMTQGTFYADICKHMGQEMAKMFAVSTVAYVAGVLTLLTSSYLAVSMTTRLTALTSTQQPARFPELPFDLREISFESVSSSVNFLGGLRKDVGCDLPATMNLPSPARLLPSSVSSISSFLYQMMVVSSLEYVSYGLPGDMSLLWGQQSDEAKPPSTPADDALRKNQQKSDREGAAFISPGNRELSHGKSWRASDLGYDQNPHTVVTDKNSLENSLYTADLASKPPQAILTSTKTSAESRNGDSPGYRSETPPVTPSSQVSNLSSWSEEDLSSVGELPRSKYPAISTALLNLVTLFSLKTSSSSHQESEKERNRCKHCEHGRRRSASHPHPTTTAEIKSQHAADPLSPNCSRRTSVSSKGDLLAKCSWSQWRSEQKSQNRHNPLPSNANPVQSIHTPPSQSSSVLSPFGSSSSSHPSLFYNPGATLPAFVPSYLKENHTLYDLPPVKDDPHRAQAESGGCFRGSLYDGGMFNQSLSPPDRVRLRSLTATFLTGSRVKEKSAMATAPARDFDTRAFASASCAGMASFRLRLANQANMAACHC